MRSVYLPSYITPPDAQAHGILESVLTCLRALLEGISYLYEQISYLMWMQQIVAWPPIRRKHLKFHKGIIMIRLQQANVKHGICAQLDRKFSVYVTPFLVTTANRSM